MELEARGGREEHEHARGARGPWRVGTERKPHISQIYG